MASKKKNIYNNSLLLFGIIAPMTLINIFSITMYVWCILFLGGIIFLQWIKNAEIPKFYNQNNVLVIVLFLTWLISYLICAIRMPEKWTEGIITDFIQLLFLLTLYVFFSQKKMRMYLLSYVKGIYISSIIQMIWGYTQIVFDSLHLDLNKIVFSDLLHMMKEYATQYQFGRLKVSGLSWNAGNLAPLVTFGYIYTKNIYLKFSFFLLGFLSGSRTLMLGLIVATILEIIITKKIKMDFTKKKFIVSIVFIVGITVLFIANINNFINKLVEISNLLNIKERVKTEGSASTHLYYITSIPEITKKNDFLSNLFGYGPGCSGYAQSELMNFYPTSDKWTIECDFANQLWSYGYVGFIVYYYWYIKNFMATLRVDTKYLILFGTFLFEGLLYNITFNWVLFLIISIFILAQSNINIFNNN